MLKKLKYTKKVFTVMPSELGTQANCPQYFKLKRKKKTILHLW